MQKFYLNTTERGWYDAAGSQPSDGNPKIPLGNTEKVIIQCCTDTTDAGTPGINPESAWTRDTQFNLPGVSALLSTDNNFTRHLKGTLKTAIPTGSVSSAVLVISGATPGKIPSNGAIRLFDSTGVSESLEYTSRSISGNDVTFELASGSSLENSYSSGADGDCPESLYAQATMNSLESDPATGLFVFDITMYSAKLREKVDYSDTKEVDDVKGLELLIFTVDGSSIETRNAYICDTFSIPVPMADPNPNPQMPETCSDTVSALINALLSQGFAIQFSVDGATGWHDTQSSNDGYFRFRALSSGPSGAWSNAIGLIVGPQGNAGVDSFCYVAYASDATGTGFSLTPTNALKFRAEIHSDTEIQTPDAEYFADAVWVKYIGDDGTGVGDMLKSIYDTDDDGVVDDAEHAAVADAVPWVGISDKPSTFPPQSHAHTMNALSDPVRQKVVSESNPVTLYLDSPVLFNSAVQSGTTIAIDFTAIKTAVSGSAYIGQAGDFLTWEYHVSCSQDIVGVTVGSLNSTMVGIAIPDTLERVNNANTTHVFVVRGIYKSGAVNNLKLQVNYAYSYEA